MQPSDIDIISGVTFTAKILLVYVGALWLCLAFWTFRDVRRRSRSIVAQLLSVIVVVALFLPGYWLYLILRPRPLAEREEDGLRRSLLTQYATLCPACDGTVREDFILCPSCRFALKTACVACSHALEPTWMACPYCGSATAGSPGVSRLPVPGQAVPQAVPIDTRQATPA